MDPYQHKRKNKERMEHKSTVYSPRSYSLFVELCAKKQQQKCNAKYLKTPECPQGGDDHCLSLV